MLAAAATDGVHTDEFNEKFGYGTLNVSGFVPASGSTTIEPFNSIKYEPFVNTSYPSANWGTVETNVYHDVNWFSVCVVLAAIMIAFWLIKMFKDYVLRRAKTNDDE